MLAGFLELFPSAVHQGYSRSWKFW